MARSTKTLPGQPDIGLVSLPVLCCLLGAALFVYEYGGHEPTLTHEFAELEQKLATERAAADVLQAATTEASARLTLIEQSLAYLREQRALAALTDRESTLRDQAQLLDALAQQAPQLAQLRAEAAQLLSAQSARTAAAAGLFGGYHGHYVLIECIDQAVTIYPGNRRLALTDFPAALPDLLTEIRACGYVALAARPSGWRDHSFSPVRSALYTALDQYPEVQRTDFPLTADEPIAAYLPTPP